MRRRFVFSSFRKRVCLQHLFIFLRELWYIFAKVSNKDPRSTATFYRAHCIPIFALCIFRTHTRFRRGFEVHSIGWDWDAASKWVAVVLEKRRYTHTHTRTHTHTHTHSHTHTHTTHRLYRRAGLESGERIHSLTHSYLALLSKATCSIQGALVSFQCPFFLFLFFEVEE